MAFVFREDSAQPGQPHLSDDFPKFHRLKSKLELLSSQCANVYTLLDTVICWTSLFVILGLSGLFCSYYSVFDGKSC